MAEDMLQQAIEAIKAGDEHTGEVLLAKVLKADPRHETALVWLYKIARTPERKREAIEWALSINPDRIWAKRAQKNLEREIARLQSSQSPPNAAPPPAETPPQPAAQAPEPAPKTTPPEPGQLPAEAGLAVPAAPPPEAPATSAGAEAKEADQRLLDRAIAWEQSGKKSSLLLKGNDLNEAEFRMIQFDRMPELTPLQIEYIIASRQRVIRQLYLLVTLVAIGAMVALGLAILALIT